MEVLRMKTRKQSPCSTRTTPTPTPPEKKKNREKEITVKSTKTTYKKTGHLDFIDQYIITIHVLRRRSQV